MPTRSRDPMTRDVVTVNVATPSLTRGPLEDSMRQDRPVVLLVTYDDEQRDELATWLDRAGLVVLPCPGPCPPDYVCVGGRRHSCPLPRAADLVVLDLQLASDELHMGTPARQLMDLYTSMGLPVIALAGPGEAPLLSETRRVRVLPRPTGRGPLLDAVRAFLWPAPWRG